MDEFIPSTPIPEWNALKSKRRKLIDACSNDTCCEAENQILEIEDQILNGNAPHLEGVILKLEILFQQYMHQQGQDAEQHLHVIGDLRRLQHQLL